MKNLQDATERICELKGSLVALDALVPAVIEALSPATRERLIAVFDAHAEAARTVMLHGLGHVTLAYDAHVAGIVLEALAAAETGRTAREATPGEVG